MGNLVGRDNEDANKKKAARSAQQLKKEGGIDSVHSDSKPLAIPPEVISVNNVFAEVGDKSVERPRIDASSEFIQQKLEELCQKTDVPMVFRWEGGGKNVYITGTFNQWAEKIPMHRSGNDFTYIHDLKKGKHAFKFIVDDEWRFAPEQPTVADTAGNINNFVDLSVFERTFGYNPDALSQRGAIVNDNLYDDEFAPDPEDPQWYTKDPPQLPPHLRQIILNASPAEEDLSNSMQIPQHVTLNHLYCSAIKDNLMVLGVTQRFRNKFVTTVFYSPLPE